VKAPQTHPRPPLCPSPLPPGGRYEDAVAAAEARLAPLFEAGELDEDEVVAEQLDAGLFTLQVGLVGRPPACD
jgi:hypothetical protein